MPKRDKRKPDSPSKPFKPKHTVTLGKNNTVLTKLFRKRDDESFDSTVLNRWLEQIRLVIQSDYPDHVEIIDTPTFYDTLEDTLRPQENPENPDLTQEQRRNMRKMYQYRLGAYLQKLDIMRSDKTRIFSMIKSAMSQDSIIECEGHSDWNTAESLDKTRVDPARLINIIKLTHRSKQGIGNIDDVQREFRTAFSNLRQEPKQSLASWYKKVSDYVQVERNVAPDERLLTEEDYIYAFREGLNSNFEKVKTQLNLKKMQDLDWWNANMTSLLQVYEHARKLSKVIGVDTRMHSDEAMTLKVTTKKDKGKSKSTGITVEDEADVFKASTKGKGKKEPSRDCRHCGHLKWISDHRHWDKDCPLNILLKNKAGSDTKPSKKRKSDDKVADTGNQNDHSDADDESIDHEAAVKNRSKKRRSNK